MSRRFRAYSRTAVVLALAAAFCATPVSGQSAARSSVEPPNLTALVAAAGKEGTLSLSVGATYGGPAGARILQAAIDKKHGIPLRIQYSPISEGVAYTRQLAQEVQAGLPASSDVMFTVDSSDLVAYLQRVDWRKYVSNLPQHEMIYGQRAVKVMTTLHAFDYNTNLVSRGQVPQSFADLLKPEWKGKIASSPDQGSFLNYIGLPDVFGHQGMLDYVRKFAGQVSGVMTCGELDHPQLDQYTREINAIINKGR